MWEEKGVVIKRKWEYRGEKEKGCGHKQEVGREGV